MKERTALVTGASRGIGAAIADRFRKAGALVLAPSRAEMDLRTTDSVNAYLSRIGASVDILVNNAGINLLGSIREVLDRDLEETMRTNLVAPLLLARGVVGGMMERGYGRIVNIGSIWGVVSRKRRVAYTVTKTGLNGLTRALAVELAPRGILVNTVAPGYVNTELTRKNNTEQELAAIRENIPLRRLGEPGEIAEVVAYLCSGKNSYITGQTIIVDGGYTCL